MQSMRINQLDQECVPASSPFGELANRLYSRIAGETLVPGNSVRLLKDAVENYPVWLEAIREAKHTIHLESYFIRDDEVGREFAEALAERARAGVRVRIIYDWFGAIGFTSRRYWKRLEKEGVEIRCINPPRFDSPFGWLSRDHRKMLTIDGERGFVFGLCIDHRWVGDPKHGHKPWRDTGVEIRGPVVADLDHSYAQVWAVNGPPLPEDEVLDKAAIPVAGDTAICVVASAPHTARLYRLDLLVAGSAQRRLWVTDAYFAPTMPYTQALIAASQGGVDVRLLVPGNSDVPFTSSMMRSGYRPLLEAGVRIFQWRGPMLHAKTAVVDGCWSRVGSTNLNVASLFGNWELDVAIEDEEFARQMEQMYEEDLSQAVEIKLGDPRASIKRRGKGRGKGRGQRIRGRARPAASALMRIGRFIGIYIASQLGLSPSAALIMAIAGLTLSAFVLLVARWPWIAAGPVVVIGGWMALSLLVRAIKLYASGKRHAEFRMITHSRPLSRRES